MSSGAFAPEEAALFPPEKIAEIRAFYATRERWRDLLDYRTLPPRPGAVGSVFYGDSITECWPLAEFFPGAALLNRGLGGDNVYGLYDRLDADVLAHRPRRVFMMVGINGIEAPPEGTAARICALARRMTAAGIRVGLCGILPLRAPDQWDRFQYQARIVGLNDVLRARAPELGCDYLDCHAAVRDATGQLAAEYARPDGTHLTFAAYRRLAEVVRPYLEMN